MGKTDTRPGYTARLVSPYLNTTGKCLELFYWITQQRLDDSQTLLRVIAISEEHSEDVLATIYDLSGHFPRLFLRLPDGTHRIAIEGERTETKILCALSLDDLTIMDCDRFGKAIYIGLLSVSLLCCFVPLSFLSCRLLLYMRI